MDSNKEKETKRIRAMIIIEVLGRPPEHLTETLNKIIENINAEKGISVENKKLKDATLLKNQKDLYVSFAEIEIEVEEILYLTKIMFKYMPSHIEIISPEVLTLSNNGWNETLNEITRRLHGYEELARVVQAERTILERKLKDALENKEPEKK